MKLCQQRMRLMNFSLLSYQECECLYVQWSSSRQRIGKVVQEGWEIGWNFVIVRKLHQQLIAFQIQNTVQYGFTAFFTASDNHLNGRQGIDRFIVKFNTALQRVTKQCGVGARNLVPPFSHVPLWFLFLISFFFFLKKPPFSEQL